MLSPSDHQLLTQVSAGTPMGDLLRRYWHPVAAIAELDDNPIKPLRFFGEDLVLYQDKGGRYGMLARHCPHRGFDLCYGIREEHGLRCTYHGWRFDETGACREQPYEDLAHPEARFRERVRTISYPVEPMGGLLWGYFGPAPVPPLPNWEPFTWSHGFVYVFFSEIPCNWVQCQENSIDPVHFEWLHLNWLREQYGEEGEPRSPRHRKLRFDEFEYGFRYGRLVEGQDESDEAWTIGRVCLWPNALFTGSHFSYRVPIDDTSTLAVDWSFTPVPSQKLPFRQERVPYSHIPLRGQDGRFLIGTLVHQDLMALAAQGTIADRSRENLGASDAGIVMWRKKLFSEARRLAEGGLPFGLVRDPSENKAIELPMMGREAILTNRPTRRQGYDAVQRSAAQNHVVSGLSAETIRMWTEIFEEPPSFHHQD